MALTAGPPPSSYTAPHRAPYVRVFDYPGGYLYSHRLFLPCVHRFITRRADIFRIHCQDQSIVAAVDGNCFKEFGRDITARPDVNATHLMHTEKRDQLLITSKNEWKQEGVEGGR